MSFSVSARIHVAHVNLRKRLPPKGQAFPPPGVVAIWVPLLDHVLLNHPTLPSAFVSRAILALLSQSSESQTQDVDYESEVDADERSYQHCVASWIAWFALAGNENSPELREEAFIRLVSGLGPGSSEDKSNKMWATFQTKLSEFMFTICCSARSLLATLSASDEHLTLLLERALPSAKADSTEVSQHHLWTCLYI